MAKSFEFADTAGKMQKVEAMSAEAALAAAKNIAPNSGVAEVRAADLAAPSGVPEIPQPKESAPPSAFVSGLDPVIEDSKQTFIRSQSEEAKKRDDILTRLMENKPKGSQDTFNDAFDDQIEGITGEKTSRFMKRLGDENTTLALLQGKFRTAGQRISSGEGQSKVFENAQLGELSRQEAVEVGNQALLVQALQGNYKTAKEIALETAKFASDDRAAELQNLITQFNALDGIVEGQEAQLVEQEKRKYEAELATLERARTAIDTAITSGGASVAEMQQLTDINIPDEQKIQLAQSIVGRVNRQDRNFVVAERARKAIEAQLAEDATKEEEEDAKSEKALGMLQSITALEEHPGFWDAVGPNPIARGWNPKGIFDVFTGNKSDYLSEVDRLANTLTLDNMKLLKGPATDKDLQIVAASMSKLKNTDVSEKAYKEELTRLREAAQRVVNNTGVSSEQASFYYGLGEDDVAEVQSVYGTTPAATSFNAASYFK